MATTGQIVEVFFENAIETFEHQKMMINAVDYFEPDAATMQNAGNTVWRPTDHHAPIIEGWDLTGQEQEIIEQTYPSTLGTPRNDFVQQRADDLRDIQFWERRGKQSGMQQATELNRRIAADIATQGSIFYNGQSGDNGLEFMGLAQTIMDERQTKEMGRYFALNNNDSFGFATELSGRQTVQGRPENAWDKGYIGNVASFETMTASFLPTMTGGATPDTTVTGNQSFKPEAGTINATTRQVTNIDYRTATVVVADSSGYNVGDKIKFTNSTGGDVLAVGLADKSDTGRAMTFTVITKPSGTQLEIYPKPIANDDSALTTTEKAYSNINTTIKNGATVTRLNTHTGNARTNIFWDMDAVEVLGGNIPANLFQEFDGMKVLTETLSNGQQMYMIYDGNIATMNFRYRCFIWYGITIRDPSRCGVALTAA